MMQFFAILKDSFREAVDGFVIYAMLALAAITMLLVGSMSFTPAPPEQAFDQITEKFNRVFLGRGRGMSQSSETSSTYKASDVTAAGGGYKFRLTATGSVTNHVVRDGKSVATGDSFRAAVAQWAAQRSAKPAEGGLPRPPVEEQLAVTNEQMEEFLKDRFAFNAGVTATAKRVTEGAREPAYAFDVTTASGAGVRGWPHTTKIFFGTAPVSKHARSARRCSSSKTRSSTGWGGVALLIGVIITAFFVPNMLRKEPRSAHLQAHRADAALVYKYIGGLTFIFLVSRSRSAVCGW